MKRIINTAADSQPTGSLQSPIFLLLATGTLIGFNFPLAKIAGSAGISAMIWVTVISFGASLLLLPVVIAKRGQTVPFVKLVRYAVISALVSFVAPNLLLFNVIPHAGAGYTGLMFALSPVFTLALASLFRLKTPSRTGIVGIAIGLAGAVVVSVTRGNAPEAPPVVWILAAILIPILLACGNIYRTLDWPENASPDVLAFWSHTFTVTFLLAFLSISRGSLPFNELALAPLATLAQVFVSGLTVAVFFRLQQKGGPVLLSQIGYVAAAVGLVTATWLLGERYSITTWVGAAIIALGISVTLVSQFYEGRNQRTKGVSARSRCKRILTQRISEQCAD